MDNSDNEQIKESIRALLSGAVDYAGLFPPAGLSMPEAVINYATYRNSNYAWMLGRFVVTAARLAEFQEVARAFVPQNAENAWRLSVVIGDDIHEELGHIYLFNIENGPSIICDAVEIKSPRPSLIETAASALPEGVTAYFEIPVDEEMPDQIATLSLTGQNAKIRTGGVTVDAFPTSLDIIRFVRACQAANVPFKATAGLHHPMRCFSPLTYEENAPNGTMHGFLNLFLMSGFAREGFKPNLLEDIMEEEFGEVFRFEEQSAIWRDEFRLNLWQIELLRSRGIHSFGSCSFDEPVADLQKLGVL